MGGFLDICWHLLTVTWFSEWFNESDTQSEWHFHILYFKTLPAIVFLSSYLSSVLRVWFPESQVANVARGFKFHRRRCTLALHLRTHISTVHLSWFCSSSQCTLLQYIELSLCRGLMKVKCIPAFEKQVNTFQDCIIELQQQQQQHSGQMSTSRWPIKSQLTGSVHGRLSNFRGFLFSRLLNLAKLTCKEIPTEKQQQQ